MVRTTEDGRVFHGERELTQFRSNVGYLVVNVNNATHYVHRLVAAEHIPNPDGKPQVAHWDGDRTNNHVSNLRWATEVENSSDKKRHGTENVGERNGKARLSESDVIDIRQLRKEKVHVDVISAKYGVSKWTIYDACNPSRQWKHI